MKAMDYGFKKGFMPLAKKIIAAALSLAMIMTMLPGAFTTEAQAASGYTYGDYTYTVSGGQATITGYDGSATDITVPGTVDGYTVTGIGREAFYYETSLTSVSLPSSVRTIGNSAFYNCYKLQSVGMPSKITSIGSYAFYNCEALKSMTIPAGLTQIERQTFSGCESLTSVSIPAGVTVIGDYAFNGCESLTSVYIPSGVTEIGAGAFYECSSLSSVQIPESVTAIGSSAFTRCSSLANITLPGNITTIQSSTFSRCSSLKSVNIPQKVTSIGSSAFNGCISLTSVTIPDSVTKIDDYAFKGCSAITSVDIPVSVTTIRYQAFYGCDSLTKAVIRNKDCYIYSNSGTFKASDGSYKVTIYGWEGSTAEEYADDYGYKFASLNGEVGKFVERLYNVILGRSSDAAGKANWTNKLVNGTKSAADIVASFFASDEYTKKNKSNSDIVEDCYKAMLNRASDSTGKANWIKYLNAGMSPIYVVKGFVGSTEFAKVCATYGISPGSVTISYYRDISYSRTSFVSRMYTKCLGRSFDSTGIENWCKHLANGMTGATLAKNFVFSKEYTHKKTSNAQFVTMLYQTLMGREPDQSGYNHWVSKLNSGTTRTAVFNGFAGSAEFKKLCNTYGIKAQ